MRREDMPLFVIRAMGTVWGRLSLGFLYAAAFVGMMVLFANIGMLIFGITFQQAIIAVIVGDLAGLRGAKFLQEQRERMER